jgi:hypothetical protein
VLRRVPNMLGGDALRSTASIDLGTADWRQNADCRSGVKRRPRDYQESAAKLPTGSLRASSEPGNSICTGLTSGVVAVASQCEERNARSPVTCAREPTMRHGWPRRYQLLKVLSDVIDAMGTFARALNDPSA